MVVLLVAALAMLSSPSVAFGAVEENVTVSLVGEVFDGICGEDVVHTAGDLHILVTATVNDNHVSGNFHLNPQGAKLVGLTTGNEYVGTGMLHESFQGSLDNGAATFTFVNNFRIVGKGQAPSYIYQVVAHTTINANGDVTADLESVTEECR
jgi:hypothetical protein